MWCVRFHRRAAKQYKALSRPLQDRVNALVLSMEQSGAIQGRWANYGKLGPNRHHCHIKKGKPTYVVVWEEIDQTIRVIEVTYVGTHEKAPY